MGIDTLQNRRFLMAKIKNFMYLCLVIHLVLFNQSFFSKLANLSEDIGAKKLIRNHYHEVFSIPFPLGAIDIDTPNDYQQIEHNSCLHHPQAQNH